VSRRLWGRQQISMFLDFLGQSINKSVVRVKWIIKPISVGALHKPGSGSLTPFAYSCAVLGIQKLECYRVIIHLETTSFINSTVWSLSSSEGTVGGIIEDAEDARAFQYKGNLYIYYQVPYRNTDGSQDCRIFIFDPIASKTRQVLCPFKFKGKNWIPFEDSGALFFVYSLQPLVVFKVTSWNNENLSTQLVYDEGNFINKSITWGDDQGAFGSIRGGSQLLQISENQFLGFTHITPPGILKFSHQAGAILYNSKENSFKHLTLTKLKPGLLIDPFGIEINGTNVRMIYSYSVNNPHEISSIVGSSVATFRISDLDFI
jgi:hypothetical protein